MTTATTAPAIPRAGMLATVRNRRGVVAAVEPFDGETGRLHLVHLEYTDDHAPAEERLLWELEPSRDLHPPNALPDPAHAGGAMPAEDFDALLRAARWTALSPYLDPGDGDGRARREPIASPFHGGVRIESYQLVPLLKALRMPRVNLLIADDVGLGKTVEAGLILTELLLRRRIQRVLVLTPASLRQQWQEELWDKFSQRFEVVDRQGTERLRRRLGMDATPWRSFSRIVASYHYLRQPDVLEQFLAACRTPEGSPHLPWDLLIVDECHNLMPSPFGEDSELCRMLRLVAPQFEHRLFLSATPHNGHTRSFTGLLEMLDPVRFSRTTEMGPAMRGRTEDVVVRRLKRDINARSGTPRFCTRLPPKALTLDIEPREADLSTAFGAFRTTVRALVARGSGSRRRTGAFAVEILGKRLLSCPTAFADSWSRARQGLSGAEPATEKDVAAAERTLRQETGDDREAQQREATAATVAGAWLRNFAGDLDAQIHDIEGALDDLGFDLDDAPTTEQTPAVDARFEALETLIDRLLIEPPGRDRGGAGNEPTFRPDERLIVFTEYKTTLDYLARRLRERYPGDRVLTLFGSGGPGGMDQTDREHVKAAFNDPASPVRMLVATDAASEGLNLHRTARYLLHYDCPWNPSRLEQRNGRIDRYGQARDVTVHHFVSTTDPDLDFLDHVIRKADEIREDRLRHGGLLLDGTRLAGVARHAPGPLDAWTEQQLRQRASAMLDGSAEASPFVAFVLEQVCGLDASTGAWTRGSHVGPAWGRRAVTGENVKPRHLWQGRRGGRLPVFLDDGRQLGIGKSRRAVSRVLGWLRAGRDHLALVTNGRQWRLVFAGLDYDAWCEWDLDLWFEEGELSPQVTALRTLLQDGLWTPESEGAEPPLLRAIRDTRKGQAELSEVLGERVREAVEILIRAHGDALSSLGEAGRHPGVRRISRRRCRRPCARPRRNQGDVRRRPRRHLSRRVPGGDAAGGDSVRGIARSAAAQQPLVSRELRPARPARTARKRRRPRRQPRGQLRRVAARPRPLRARPGRVPSSGSAGDRLRRRPVRTGRRRCRRRRLPSPPRVRASLLRARGAAGPRRPRDAEASDPHDDPDPPGPVQCPGPRARGLLRFSRPSTSASCTKDCSTTN